MINMDKLPIKFQPSTVGWLPVTAHRCRFGRCLAHSEEHSVACGEGRYIEEEFSEN